jgi:hypothetical protein
MDTPTKKIEDSIAKIDEELAVGEDLSFQRKWWSFEKWIWRLFALIVLADLLGAFGRGPLANASKSTSDRALVVHYERIERFSTPSILKINVGPSAVDHGEIRLWVSTSVISRLGNQRIIPEPSSSQIVKGGVVYTFASGSDPSLIAFALQPADIGFSHLTIRLLSGKAGNGIQQDFLTLDVFVMP